MMKTPDDIEGALATRYVSNLADWLIGDGSWPATFRLGVPTNTQFDHHLQAVEAWALAWRQWDEKHPGIVEWVTKQTLIGKQEFPARVTFASVESVLAALPSKQSEWDAAISTLQRLHEEWGLTVSDLRGVLRRFLVLSEQDVARLTAVCRWLVANPASGLMPRQLPIPGVDTKWFHKHRVLIVTLLRTRIPVEPIIGSDIEEDEASEIEDALVAWGLVLPPREVHLVLANPALRKQFAECRTVSVNPLDLTSLDPRPNTLLVVENKESAVSLPDYPGTLIVHSLGKNVRQLANIGWIHDVDVLYWGDIDTHGLQILDHLRSLGIAACSILMDLQTLHTHEALWGEGSRYELLPCPNLTADEAYVYEGILENKWGTNVRLEQERIGFSHVTQTIAKRVAGC